MMYEDYQYDALEDQIAELSAYDTFKHIEPKLNSSKDMEELFSKTEDTKNSKHSFAKTGINNPKEVPPPHGIELLVSSYVEPLKSKEDYNEAL